MRASTAGDSRSSLRRGCSGRSASGQDDAAARGVDQVVRRRRSQDEVRKPETRARSPIAAGGALASARSVSSRSTRKSGLIPPARQSRRASSTARAARRAPPDRARARPSCAGTARGRSSRRSRQRTRFERRALLARPRRAGLDRRAGSPRHRRRAPRGAACRRPRRRACASGSGRFDQSARWCALSSVTPRCFSSSAARPSAGSPRRRAAIIVSQSAGTRRGRNRARAAGCRSRRRGGSSGSRGSANGALRAARSSRGERVHERVTAAGGQLDEADFLAIVMERVGLGVDRERSTA